MYRKPLQNVSNSIEVLNQKRKLGNTIVPEEKRCKKIKDSAKENISNISSEIWRLPVECVESDEDLQLEEYIGRWMKKREHLHIPKSHYLSWQPEITPRMRAILVDWLTSVAVEFKLQRDTTHTTINYVDRLLSLHPKLPKDKLQLVGVAALFLASKVEEIEHLEIKQLVDICDNAYTSDEIFQMERILTMKLTWNLLPVTAFSWLKLFFELYTKFNKITPSDIEHVRKEYFRCMQLLDYCVLDYTTLTFAPSTLAATIFSTFCTDAQLLEKLTHCSVDADCRSYVAQYEQISPGKPYITPIEFLDKNFHEVQFWSNEALSFVKRCLKKEQTATK